jgi:anti-anti-sigma regulatory factor
MSNAPGNRGDFQGGADGARAPSTNAAQGSWSDALAAADAISALLAHPVDVEERGVAVIVKAAGPHLAQRECPAIIDAAQAAFQRAHGRTFAVLDLSDVQVFSAMGVGLCTDFAKRAKERKLTPVLYGLRGDLLNQLRMFKIERLFTVVRSRGDLEQLVRGS